MFNLMHDTGMGNRFDDLRNYPAEVLDEVVREAEQNLGHQLSSGAALQQRATSLIGAIFTAVTVAFAGAFSLYRSGESPIIVYLAIGYGLALLACGLGLASTIGPTERPPVGNEPNSWLLHNWPVADGQPRTLVEARISQLNVLQDGIDANLEITRSLARRQRLLIYGALSISALAGVGFAALIAEGDLKKADPPSQQAQLAAIPQCTAKTAPPRPPRRPDPTTHPLGLMPTG